MRDNKQTSLRDLADSLADYTLSDDDQSQLYGGKQVSIDNDRHDDGGCTNSTPL